VARLSGFGIEIPERALPLRRVPHTTIGGRRHIVRMRAVGHRVFPHIERRRDAACNQT